MDSILDKKFWFIFGGLFVFELLAAFSFFQVGLSSILFFLVLVVVLALTVYRLEYGLLLLMAELIIGSKGHLLSFDGFSLRLGLFLIVFLVGLVQIIRFSDYRQKMINFPLRAYFLALLAFFLIGCFQGFLNYGPVSNLWLDANSWLFFALLPILIVVYYKNEDSGVYQRLGRLALAAILWLAFKTLLLFYVFSHDFTQASALYQMIRRTGVGEITNIGFNWPRVFLQSQIYIPIAFLFLIFQRSAKFSYYLLLTLLLSVTLISFSRSFWAGLLLAYFFSVFIIIKKDSLRYWLKSLPGLISVFVASLVLIYGLAFFPWPDSLVSFSTDIFAKRANVLSQEAAIASRWSLLSPLWEKTLERPVLGQGFGTTVSYISSDPRVLASSPSGEYSTYAFEWGYFDIALKIGYLGVIVYLLLIWQLIRRSFLWGLREKNTLLLSLSASLVFLSVVHIFSPYLNHPLGIILILLSSCFIFKDKVY